MQRVAIGRALVRSPAIYLMDEPLSSLDAKLRGELRLELKRIQTDLGATILYVTHDQTEAMTMARRIGVIEHGRLVQIGTPREIYENPSTPMSPRGSASRRSTCCRRRCFPAAPRRRHDDRRAHRAPDDRARRRRRVRRPSRGSSISATRAISISTLAANPS